MVFRYLRLATGGVAKLNTPGFFFICASLCCAYACGSKVGRYISVGLVGSHRLNAYRVTIEYTRAQANDELIQTLQDLEQEDTARFERMHDEWDKQLRDPDDVFFHASERRQEIKEQIRDLQRALQRQHPRKNKRRARQKSRLR